MLFVGDDWAEDHHDVEVQDEQGRAVKRARLPEGMAGMSRFHELVASVSYILQLDWSQPAAIRSLHVETDQYPVHILPG